MLSCIFNMVYTCCIPHCKTGYRSHKANKSCKPNFAHLKKLYALEKHKSLKVAHALKKASLNPSNIAKTSPQHALSKYSVKIYMR